MKWNILTYEGKLFLVHGYRVVPPNSDYTPSFTLPGFHLGLGYPSNLDGRVFPALPIKYCSCSRSPWCKISSWFRGDFTNAYVSVSNNFSMYNAYYIPTLPFVRYFSHLTAWNRLYNPWSNYKNIFQILENKSAMLNVKTMQETITFLQQLLTLLGVLPILMKKSLCLRIAFWPENKRMLITVVTDPLVPRAL